MAKETAYKITIGNGRKSKTVTVDIPDVMVRREHLDAIYMLNMAFEALAIEVIENERDRIKSKIRGTS